MVGQLRDKRQSDHERDGSLSDLSDALFFPSEARIGPANAQSERRQDFKLARRFCARDQ